MTGWPSCPHYIRTILNLSYLNKAFTSIVQLRNAAATQACRGGRIPGDPKAFLPPPPPGMTAYAERLPWNIKQDCYIVKFHLHICSWRTFDQHTNAIDLWYGYCWSHTQRSRDLRDFDKWSSKDQGQGALTVTQSPILHNLLLLVPSILLVSTINLITIAQP